MPGHASGNSMVRSIRQPDAPQMAAASRWSSGMASKARCIGCTANGRLTSSEATSRPLKLKARDCPKTACQACPRYEAPPKDTSR